MQIYKPTTQFSALNYCDPKLNDFFLSFGNLAIHYLEIEIV